MEDQRSRKHWSTKSAAYNKRENTKDDKSIMNVYYNPVKAWGCVSLASQPTYFFRGRWKNKGLVKLAWSSCSECPDFFWTDVRNAS